MPTKRDFADSGNRPVLAHRPRFALQRSMTNESPSSQERIAPDQHVTAPAHLDGSWEAVGRKAVATLLEDAPDDLTMETELAVDDVRRGERVTIDHVSRLCRTLDALEAAVE
jgi:hypothetical protein